jgi:hypothetical protein
MLPTITLQYIAYQEQRRLSGGKNCRLLAILFCRPELDLMRTAIIPSVPYFHTRSGGNTAFYFGGFEYDADDWGLDPSRETGSVLLNQVAAPNSPIRTVTGTMSLREDTYFSIQGPGAQIWYFVAKSFNSFRKQVEAVTKWRYSGGCDMILLNSRSRPGQPFAELDFSSSIALRLDKIQELVATPTVSTLFEAIFQYAERQDPNDPAWGLSDCLGLKTAITGLWSAVLSVLPQGVRTSVNAARQLVVQNIARPAES